MADELNQRRNFIKRAGVAATVVAGSVIATAATTESQPRGAGNNTEMVLFLVDLRKKRFFIKKQRLGAIFITLQNN